MKITASIVPLSCLMLVSCSTVTRTIQFGPDVSIGPGDRKIVLSLSDDDERNLVIYENAIMDKEKKERPFIVYVVDLGEAENFCKREGQVQPWMSVYAKYGLVGTMLPIRELSSALKLPERFAVVVENPNKDSIVISAHHSS